jgi:Transposase DDE domain
MHQRNGIEGTISGLTRAHGMRRNRYRGLAKARFQNLFIATACNIKQWLKLEGAKRDESASYVYVCMYRRDPRIQPPVDNSGSRDLHCLAGPLHWSHLEAHRGCQVGDGG